MMMSQFLLKVADMLVDFLLNNEMFFMCDVSLLKIGFTMFLQNAPGSHDTDLVFGT